MSSEQNEVKFTNDDWKYILEVLSRQPYREVVHLFQKFDEAIKPAGA